jgi:hypothetical protein
MLIVLATQQQRDERQQHAAREGLAQVSGEPLAGDAADARADQLRRDHERVREQHRPQEAGAELRADLGVGSDAARVVVGGSREQARSDQRRQALLPRARWRIGPHGGVRSRGGGH